MTAVRLRRSAVEHWLAIFVASLICSVHFGLNEYASAQFVGFLVVAGGMAPTMIRYWREQLIIVVVVAVVVSSSFYFGDHDLHLLLKGIRTGLAFCVLHAVTRWSAKASWIDWPRVTGLALLIACLAALTLGSLQLLDSLGPNTGLFDIPSELFALDYGTIFTDRRSTLSGAGYFIRPYAFFSEPSALAVLGLTCLIVGHVNQSRRMMIVGFVVAVVSCSLIGLLFAPTIVLLSQVRRFRETAGVVFVPALVISVLVVVVAMGTIVGDRVESVLMGDDISARIRLVEPLAVISRIFSDGYYFGVSEDYALRVMSTYVYTVFSNWALNQFIFYGVFGVVLISLPYFILRRSIWPLLLVMMVANGDAFYYDRVLLLAVAIAVINQYRGRFG